jgi:hypothetical protein
MVNPSSSTPCAPVKLPVGSDVKITCGSITVRVLAGPPRSSFRMTRRCRRRGRRGDGRNLHERVVRGGRRVGRDGQVTLTTGGGSVDLGPSPTPISLWDFVGFSAPLVSGFDTVNAGGTVPLKWRLLDEAGAPILGLGSVVASVAPVDCVSGDETGAGEAVPADALSLQSLGDGYYRANWKTAAKVTGCKVLHLSLTGEGPITHDALFKL